MQVRDFTYMKGKKPSWKGNRKITYEESLNKSGIKVKAEVEIRLLGSLSKELAS